VAEHRIVELGEHDRVVRVGVFLEGEHLSNGEPLSISVASAVLG
jgi:hypothetical protein